MRATTTQSLREEVRYLIEKWFMNAARGRVERRRGTPRRCGELIADEAEGSA
jgi:hypothetical protein